MRKTKSELLLLNFPQRGCTMFTLSLSFLHNPFKEPSVLGTRIQIRSKEHPTLYVKHQVT